MNENYDSTPDTMDHIQKVQANIEAVNSNLSTRAYAHDASKLASPEKEAFDVLTPRLRGLTYGSDEYRSCLREMKPALQHHYANNTHHPEHYENGVSGMSLMDVMEMLCDWRAAGMRHADGSMAKSLEHNKDRFKM